MASSCLGHKPEMVSVVLPSGDVHEWKLKWSPGRNDECYLGAGWYEFKIEHNLQAGDRVKFSRRGYENQFIVDIV